jgi:hypothetical protein
MRHKLRYSLVAATLLGALGSQLHAADVLVNGALKFEAWAAVDGNPPELMGANLDDATVLPLIPSFGAPEVLYMDRFNTRSVYPNDSHENYLARITGTLTVPVSGTYHVFLRADDDARFYINLTGETPPDITSGTVVPLVKEDADCCDGFIAPGEDLDGDGFGDGDAEATTLISSPLNLTAGTRYGITALLKEGGGGDWLELDVRKTDDTRANAPLPGSYLATMAPAVAITTQPASWTTSENFPTTNSVVVNTSAGVSYQWKVGGVDIPGATNASYVFTPTPADNGKVYTVVVTQASTPPSSVTSSGATLTVSNDTTPPTIVGAGTFLDRNGVLVTFSEPIGTGLTTAGNYAISGGATVNSAEAVGDSAVYLKTTPLTASANLTLTVSNVRDKATGGGNLVTPNTRAFTVSGPPPAGSLIHVADWEEYLGATLDTLDDVIAAGTPPDDQKLMSSFEAPVNTAEGFTGRLRGYFVPPQTGSYVFYGSADDGARFFLSTDSDPANKKQIAAENAWSNNREWITSGGASNLNNKRSDRYAATQWPTGGKINLVGGVPYYVEARYQEGGGGDNGSMTFKLESEADPASGTPTRIIGDALVWYGDPNAVPLSVTMPASKVFRKGDTVTLDPVVNGPGTITYQWYKNKKPIAGATSRVLTLTNADYDDIGDYQLEVSNGGDPVRGNAGSGDDNSRLYMEGITMIVEAEDYNYGGGQTKPEASATAYRGDAYKGLKGTLDIDFFHDGDNSGGAAFAYQRAAPADEGVIEDKGGTDAVNNALGRNRGSFSMTANYALGWTTIGEWQNYTRTFPKGKYVVIGGMSHDGAGDDEVNMILSKVANPTVADGSAIGTEGGAQGLTKLGTFLGQGTGAWSSNDMIPLTDDSGNIVQLDLDGTTTLRLTFNAVDGDADWMAFYCIDCAVNPTQPTLTITRSGNNVTITSSDGGTVQGSPTIAPATWTDVGPAPQTVSSATGNRYFRVRK